MKICLDCKISKDESEFAPHNTRKDGLRANCKECGRKASNDFYARKPKEYKERAAINRPIQRQNRKNLINAIRSKYGCAICEERTLQVMDFHHLDPKTKSFSVSSPRDKSLHSLFMEINKCVVLCANCHRKAHAGLIELSPTMRCNESIDKSGRYPRHKG